MNRMFQANGKKRVWVTVGVAKPVLKNAAGRAIDENDEIVTREARAIKTARNLTPNRVRRYEEHTN